MEQNNTTPEALRLIAAALALLQAQKSDAMLVQLPGTGRYVAIGTPEEVAGLLEAGANEECRMCNGGGIVGFPPDQHEECPDCIKTSAALAQRASSASANLLGEIRTLAETGMSHGLTADDFCSQIVAKINAATPASAQPVAAAPAGWKLVPLEPTDAMRIAAREVVGSGSTISGHVYRAMLAAAPAAPVAQADERRELDAALRQEVATMYQLLDDGEWGEHLAVTPEGQCLETAITKLMGRVAQATPASAGGLDAVQDAAAQHEMALVPLYPNRAMRDVMADDEWKWEDLLAAAEAITEDQYAAVAARPDGASGASAGADATDEHDHSEGGHHD